MAPQLACSEANKASCTGGELALYTVPCAPVTSGCAGPQPVSLYSIGAQAHPTGLVCRLQGSGAARPRKGPQSVGMQRMPPGLGKRRATARSAGDGQSRALS